METSNVGNRSAVPNARIDAASGDRSAAFDGTATSDFRCVTIVAALATLALLLLRATTTGLLCDELLFVHAVDLGPVDGLFAPGSSHPPLLRLLVGSFADSASPDWVLRLPCLLFSVGSVLIWSRVLVRLCPDLVCRGLLLAAMALNPAMLELGFQCLPYAPLTFFASLHCLAWMRFIENDTLRNRLLLAGSGVALPWVHFFGIHVLLVDQIVWLALLRHRRTTIAAWLKLNFAIAALTVPVVPVALFYAKLEGAYSIVRIDDFRGYFVSASAAIFSDLTFPGIGSSWPLYLPLYAFVAAYAVRMWRSGRELRVAGHSVAERAMLFGTVAIAILLAGFPFAQLHSVLSQKAFWPRYAIAGAWLHLPVIVLLLSTFAGRLPARGVATFATLAAAANVLSSQPLPGTDYAEISATIRDRWNDNDAFVAQRIDMWDDGNEFDRLWFRRYVGREGRVISGPPLRRHDLYESGLPLQNIDASVSRIWVYSHLFRRDWLLSMRVRGWELREVISFGGPFPLALFVRQPDVAEDSRRSLAERRPTRGS
ncbi:MAG: hypothetical protein R3C19_18145 [Planctomycetaceae bacterium]